MAHRKLPGIGPDRPRGSVRVGMRAARRRRSALQFAAGRQSARWGRCDRMLGDRPRRLRRDDAILSAKHAPPRPAPCRSEEHTYELQTPMRISYAVFCLQKKHKATDNK